MSLDRVIEPYDVTFGDPDAVTAHDVHAQLCVFGIDQVESLLPRRYLGVLSEAAGIMHRSGDVMRLTDLYAGAPGIGYQRGVLARLLQPAAGHGDTVDDRWVS